MNKFIIALIIGAWVLSAGCNNKKRECPVAQKGIIDLRNWDFKNDGSVKLIGEWEFYGKQLLLPKEICKQKQEKKYFKVPGYWSFKNVDNNESTGVGYATFRLTILHNSIGNLDLHVGEQMTAHKSWCNNSEIFSCGRVAKNKEKAQPAVMQRITTINLSENTTQIIFQISNFNHSRGGFCSAPRLGEHYEMQVKEHQDLAFYIFLLGGIILIALYNLGIFIFRKEDTTPLLLSLSAITLAITTIFAKPNFVSIVLPDISWELHYRIEYAVLYIAAALLAVSIIKISGKDISKKHIFLYITLTLITSLTIFLPTQIFTSALISGFFVAVTIIFYFYIIIKQFRNRRYVSLIFFLSFIVYIASVLNDLLLVRTLLIWDTKLIPLGTLLFVFGQSLVYVNTVARKLDENKTLNNILDKKNLQILAINKDLETQKSNLIKSEAKMRELIKLLPEAIFEFDSKGNITLANDEFYKQLLFIPQNTLNIENLISKNSENSLSFMEFITSSIQHTSSIRKLRINMMRSDESELPVLISISRATEEIGAKSYRGTFVDISQRVTDEEIIDNAFKDIKIKNKNILDSLRYALTIQNTVMPTEELMNEAFKEFFIINKPHSIVSGDFYYLSKKKNKIIFALSDCTGHGVPGGFMTMLGITLLNEMYGGENVPAPNYTLEKMRSSIIEGLHQESSYLSNKDGMDIILCTLNTESLELEFASAGQPLYIIRNNELLIYLGDKMPVGIYLEMKPFTTHKLQLEKDDVLYFFTDGVVDLFGGSRRKKLFHKGLQKIIKLYHNKPVKEQGILIEKKLEEWQGKNKQVDDMLMIGIRV